MPALEIYQNYGFKFFPCRADKTPGTRGDWRLPENHLTIDQARQLQSTGQMIGAWIPKDVIVIDLDRHEGKPDGLQTIKEIKKEYNIHLDFMDETFVVRTAGKGLHVFMTTDREWRQNSKAPGVDLKTHKGYVIAAGSPGYEALNSNEPMPMPQEIEQWLEACEERRGTKTGDNGEDEEDGADGAVGAEGSGGKGKKKGEKEKRLLPVKTLRRILKKIDPAHFASNDRWLEFIMSAMAAAGTGQDVKKALDEWSRQDPAYSDNRDIFKRIDSFDSITDYSVGSFIHYMREEDLSQHLITQVVKLDTIGNLLVSAEQQEKDILFECDYNELSLLPEARELFTLQGHSAGAMILLTALSDQVIFVDGEKTTYYFDGNRWCELADIYSIVYTILSRVIRIVYGRSDGTEADNTNMYKCLSCLNTLYWKESAWKEFTRKDGVYKKSVAWDGPRNRETLTCLDGVIDFKGEKIELRKGKPEEYRRFAVEYTVEEIGKAKKPERFLSFLADIIPDKDTLTTLEYYLSLMISGNASKRIFSIWKGSGKNGKSTLKEIIIQVLGSQLVTSFAVGLILQSKDADGLGVTPEMAKLQGALAAFTSEVDEYQKLNATKIKNLCGDETIQANPKHREPIEFEATWQMVLLCNDFPRFNASDSALIDRLLIVPFDIKYFMNDEDRKSWIGKGAKRENLKPGKNKKEFIPEIIAERPGIIRWMIEKYNELENKLGGVVPVSQKCIDLKSYYIYENDDFGQFIRVCCEIDTEKGYFISTEKITEKYRDFMQNPKISSISVTKGIIQSTGEVVKKCVNPVTEYNSFGEAIVKARRGLAHIRLKDFEETSDSFKPGNAVALVDLGVSTAEKEKPTKDDEAIEALDFDSALPVDGLITD